ncbi:MAG: cellulase family glycosylhydrolase [Acetobacteraceae bacterium]|nr:cellulase family glycosylhydrolase [Acetobacteraceae bacterium]
MIRVLWLILALAAGWLLYIFATERINAAEAPGLRGSAGVVSASADALGGPPKERLDVLARGINITNWFRFPARIDGKSLRSYMSDRAIDDLKRAGFTFVRLPIQPELLQAQDILPALQDGIRRLQRRGFGVIVVPHSVAWRLEHEEADRRALIRAWHELAVVLRQTDPRLTFPEIVNEPVFARDARRWAELQREVLAVIRAELPANTVVLTGNDWGSVDGLLALDPVPDRNVVYSFHFYEPAELTSLAAYMPGLDRAALGRLPFPVDEQSCKLDDTDSRTAAIAAFYCSQHWDAARLEAPLAQAAEWGRRNHVTVLMDEFGASRALNGPARLAWLSAVRRASEREQTGWALWGYDDVMGFDVPRPPGLNPSLDPATLQALGLSRP